MIRTLHILRSDADSQTRRCVEHLSRELGSGYDVQVRTCGRRGDWPSLPAAIVGLRRLGHCDLIHAWSLDLLSAAAMATRARLLYSPAALLQARPTAWLRAIMSYRDVQVICPSATLQRAMVSRGVPLEQCHLIRPGVEFARIRRQRDRQLRAALGFSPEDYILLAAGESTKASCHRDAVWAAAILHVLDPHYKLLLWGRGPDLEAVRRFHHRLNTPRLVCIAQNALGRPVEFEELLPATDMILASASGVIAPLPVCISMAAGLPIVATATHTLSELLEDHHTALMVPRHSPRLMAQRILELREDSSLQWRLSDRARVEAYEYFPLSRFLEQYRAVYRQIAESQAIQVPQPLPGAGTRFHGRA